MATCMASATSHKPRVRVRVRRASPADAPEIVRIHFDAFGSSIMNRLMYPGGATESVRARFEKVLFPPPAEGEDPSKPSPVEIFIMVAELPPDEGDAKPEIVAFAKYSLVREPLPEEKWNVHKDMTVEDLGEGVDVEVSDAFIGGLQRLGRRYMRGDPCLHLEILACTSTRQRLGAGSELLAWGNELADREAKVHWLEASPHGYPLYRRFGFEDVEPMDLKVTELWGPEREEHENWGGNSGLDLAGPLANGCFRSMLMRRFPQKA